MYNSNLGKHPITEIYQRYKNPYLHNVKSKYVKSNRKLIRLSPNNIKSILTPWHSKKILIVLLYLIVVY